MSPIIHPEINELLVLAVICVVPPATINPELRYIN